MARICKLLLLFIWVPCAGLRAQNAPVTTAGNRTTTDTSVTVPLTAMGFSHIGSCGLEIRYDPAIALATAVTAGPLLGGGLNTNLTEAGRIILGWYAWPGVTLPDSTVIFNLTFSKVSAGTTTISFFDDGSSCFYANDSSQTLNDLPASSYYFKGSVTFQPLGVEEAGREILRLSVYPNPFTGRATARWYAPFTGIATLYIYNLLGEQVELVEKRIEQPGAQELGIPSGRLSPGIYTVRILLRGNGRILMGTTKAVCCG